MQIMTKEAAEMRQLRSHYLNKHSPMPTHVTTVELTPQEKKELQDQIDRGIVPF